MKNRDFDKMMAEKFREISSAYKALNDKNDSLMMRTTCGYCDFSRDLGKVLFLVQEDRKRLRNMAMEVTTHLGDLHKEIGYHPSIMPISSLFDSVLRQSQEVEGKLEVGNQ